MWSHNADEEEPDQGNINQTSQLLLLVSWFGLLNYMKYFPSFRALIALIGQTFIDIIEFLILVGILTLVMAFNYMLTYYEEDIP